MLILLRRVVVRGRMHAAMYAIIHSFFYFLLWFLNAITHCTIHTRLAIKTASEMFQNDEGYKDEEPICIVFGRDLPYPEFWYTTTSKTKTKNPNKNVLILINAFLLTDVSCWTFNFGYIINHNSILADKE